MNFPQLQQVYDAAADRYGFVGERPSGKVSAARKDASGWTLYARDFTLCADPDMHHVLLIRRLPDLAAPAIVAPRRTTR